MLSFLLLSGAVVEPWQKRIALITEKNFQIGGNPNGKQQPNSHQKAQSSTILSIALKILKVEYNPVNLLNGLKLYSQLISIHPEEMSWAILQSLLKKH